MGSFIAAHTRRPGRKVRPRPRDEWEFPRLRGQPAPPPTQLQSVLCGLSGYLEGGWGMLHHSGFLVDSGTASVHPFCEDGPLMPSGNSQMWGQRGFVRMFHFHGKCLNLGTVLRSWLHKKGRVREYYFTEIPFFGASLARVPSVGHATRDGLQS